MTYAELDRAIESKQRVYKQEAKEKASFDYILADLIGRSIARIYNASATLPEVSEVYPTLFDTQEIAEQKQEAIDKLSIARFKQFTQLHNSNFKAVNITNEYDK